jgi:hypothetical protein
LKTFTQSCATPYSSCSSCSSACWPAGRRGAACTTAVGGNDVR